MKVAGVRRQLLGDVQDEFVFLAGREDGENGAVWGHELPRVSDLSAAFGVEGGEVEDELETRLVLDLDLAPPRNPDFRFHAVVADEFLHAVFFEDIPISGFHLAGSAGAVLLASQGCFESGLVHFDSLLSADEGGQINREAEGVVEFEGGLSVEALGPSDLLFEPLDALVEGAQEALLLFLHHLGDEGLLGAQFGEEVAHLVGHDVHQLEEERTVEAEEAVSVSHGAAQDAPDDVAGTCIGQGVAHLQWRRPRPARGRHRRARPH